MKKIVQKSLQMIMLIGVLKTGLVANDTQGLNNVLWKRTLPNNCIETFTFNAGSNTFTFASSFGKKMIGYYAVEKGRSSKRLKMTYNIKIDNGGHDCFSQNYNNTNQVVVNYLWLTKNGQLLNSSAQEKGNVFNSYASSDLYTTDNLTLIQTYLTQMALNEREQLQSTSGTKTVMEQMIALEKKQREESLAFNKMIIEEVRKSKVNNATITSNNNKSWKELLTPQQLIAQQKFDNKLAEENNNYVAESRRAEDIQNNYIQESYRSEAIQNDYVQQSYVQEQINQDYFNGY